MDLRTTKFFDLGAAATGSIGVFIEAFNLFNTANFGGSFSGNARSTNFRQPTDFVPGSATRARCNSARGSCSRPDEREQEAVRSHSAADGLFLVVRTTEHDSLPGRSARHLHGSTTM
jgi:hypothetical protein